MKSIFISMMLIALSITLLAGQPDVTIPEIQKASPGQENPIVLDDPVHVNSTVTVGTDIFYTGVGFSFYVQDSEGGPFSGTSAYIDHLDSMTAIISGDSVCFDALISYIQWPHDSIPQYIVLPGLDIISHGHQLPEVAIITGEMLDSTGHADSLMSHYAACRVRINEVTVDSVVEFSNTSIWICHDATLHQFYIREASDSISYIPAQGTTFNYVQGVFCYRQGNYYIQPAYIRDIGLLDGPIITDAGHWPENPTSNDTITFSCNVIDDGEVVGVDLLYRVNLGAWAQVTMTEGDNNDYYFHLPPLISGYRLDYAIKAEDDEGNDTYWPTEGYISIIIDNPSAINEHKQLPIAATLCQNYPNPFNSSTAIAFNLPEPTSLTLKIYDLLGRDIQTLADSYYRAGYYTIEFNASQLPSGLYFYSLQAGSFVETKRLLLLK